MTVGGFLRKSIFADKINFLHYFTNPHNLRTRRFIRELGHRESSPDSWINIATTKLSSKNEEYCA